MKILIVDDEALARERLQRLIEELDAGEVVGQAANGKQALQEVERLTPDLVLLDIRMPEMDGIETAQHLSELPTPPAVIFVTAYDEYALHAFETRAVDYLVKPVRRERLLKALGSAQRITKAQIQSLQLTTGSEPLTITARIHGGVRQIDVDTIYYFQAEHKYVTLKYAEGEVIIDDSLKSLEQQYGERFLRIHRNALIAKNQLKAIRKDQLGQYWAELKDLPQRLEISRRHVAAVRQYLKGG